MDELSKIRERYESRKEKGNPRGKGAELFDYYHRQEKEIKTLNILRKRYGSEFSELRFLEIGAGTGNNLPFFLDTGFNPENIWANELLDDRNEILRKNFPLIQHDHGDASQLKYHNKFDIVYQSVVFTSILDKKLKEAVATNMWRMLKPGGIILWYDFQYDNPGNQDVKGIGEREIKSLFPEAKSIIFTKTTLAPPIGRRVFGLYNLINKLLPFLRTHLIAEIEK